MAAEFWHSNGQEVYLEVNAKLCARRLDMKPKPFCIRGGQMLLAVWVALWQLSQAQERDEEGGPTIRFLNPPETLEQQDYLIHVLYSCKGKQVVNVELLASSAAKSDVPVFKRRWACSREAGAQVKEVRLDLPDRLVYGQDDIIKHPVVVRELELRASIHHDWRESGAVPVESSYQEGAARTSHRLQPVSLLRRPFKAHPRSLRWDQEILWGVWRARGLQCKAPQDPEHFLAFVYASSGKQFGVLKKFEPLKDRHLEKMRQDHIMLPRCTFALWLFLASPCQQEFCGVLYHLSQENEYTTPTVLLTRTGHLHVQVELEARHRAAVQSLFPMPRSQWCQISLTLKGRLVNLTTVCVEGEKKTQDSFAHRFPTSLYLDDTQGQFVMGGSKYILGIQGFFGPSDYYRSGTHSSSQIELPKLLGHLGLPKWFAMCQMLKHDVFARLHLYQLQRAWMLWQETCHQEYAILATQHKRISPGGPQCLQWEAPYPRRRAALYTLLRLAVWRKGEQLVESEALAQALFQRFEKQVAALQDLAHLKMFSRVLLQAGCLGCSRALYLVATLHQTGFGLDLDPSKALKFGLLSAQADDRLSKMQLGHKHHLGVDGFPVDHDLSYAYYASVAAQTIADRELPREGQAFVERIRLIDEDVLKAQTRETDGLFLWLRFQARRGAAKAQKAVSRMLFWGLQGISSNLKEAVKFYEKGAAQLKDPTLMYDYGVVLLKGQGVKQDIPKALKWLNQAAEQGFPPALTALGWYYQVFENDYRRAVEFWEKADEMGNSEAPSNLGALYASGLYPGKGRDEVMAYHYFLKSATRGHTDGAVQLAAFFSRGIPGVLSRKPLDAVLWAKWVSEQNGFLGAVLRRALDAYLQQSWPETLLYYLLAAEAGIEVAQFNLGFLCDQDPGGLVSHYMQVDCPWRYYNLSTFGEQPAAYALLRMGDLLYGRHPEDGRQDVRAALQMYTAAALLQDPQGLYNLGLLLEEGVSVPKETLQELGFSSSVPADSYALLMELYRRCRDHQEGHSFIPCSLALFSVHLKYIWTFHGAVVKFSGMAAVAVISGLGLLTMLRRLQNRNLGLPDSV